MTTVKFDTLRDRWMRDPEFREAYERISPAMEIAFAIAEARQRASSETEASKQMKNLDTGNMLEAASEFLKLYEKFTKEHWVPLPGLATL